MNLFGREMKASRKSLLLWLAGIVALIAGGMGEYAGMSESGAAMQGLLEDMPKALQAVIGAGGLDVSTVTGYYGMLYLYLMLMAAIHASMLGAGIVSKEERDKTAEFLLSKPISRNRLLTAKLLAALVNLLVFNVSALICSLAAVRLYEGAAAAAGDIAALMLGMLLVQLVFASVGTAIAAAGGEPKRAAAVSAGIMLLTFLLSLAIEISGHFDFLRFLSPFQYAAAAEVIDEGVQTVYVLLSLAIAAVSLAVAFRRYGRRDMRL